MSQKNEVNALPSSTIRLLGSSQVITSVFSVVKELTENALDADANSIDVKLEDFGLGKVEVRDNGSGIPSTHVPFIAKRYHTTKITAFSDLEHLTTYGFRGEALGSLCTVSSLSITTKTASDDISLTYSFDTQGQITGTKPSHLLQGTTISAVELFKNLPVRRNYYKTNKRKKEELKKIEDLLMAYGIICPKLRLTLRNNKDIIWQKNPVSEMNEALAMLGRDIISNLEHREFINDESNVHMDFFLPKPYCKENHLSRSSNDRCFTFINKRPVTNKNIEKLMRQYIECEPGRWPVYVVTIDLNPSDVDVNVEPNKTQVFMQPKDFVIETIRGVLEEMYGTVSDRKKKEHHGNAQEDMVVKNGHTFDRNSELSSIMTNNDSCETEVRIVSVNDCSKLESDIPVFKLDSVGNVSKSFSEISHTENYEETGSRKEKEDEVTMQRCDRNDTSKDSCGPLGETITNRDSPKSDRYPSDNTNPVLSQHFSVVSTDISDRTLLDVVADTQQDSDSTEVRDRTFSEVVDGTPQDSDKDCVLTQTVSGCFDIANPDLKHIIDLSDDDEEVDSTKKEVQTDTSGTTNQSVSKESTVGLETSVVDSGDTSVTNRNGNVESSVGLEDSVIDIGDDSVTELFKRWDENDPFNTTEAILSACTSDSTILKDGQWSKGQGLKSSSGDVIQPVSLLCGGKRPLSPSISTSSSSPAKKIKLLSSNSNMTNGESAKRNITAFEIYSKAVTPKVIREFPNKDVEYISQVIQERWISLPAGEKTQYELRAGAAGSHQKERQKKTPAKSLSKLNHKIKEPASVTIKEQLLKASKSNSKMVTEKKVDFHMKELKQIFQRKTNGSQTECPRETLLIGPLKSCGVWICHHGNQIQLLNPHRIQETVIFHNLMSNHVLPTQILEKPIPITKSRLGDNLWRSLEKLAREHQTDQAYSVLGDVRLVNNGIQIQFYFGKSISALSTYTSSGELSCKLTGLCPLIPMYGMDDISEILDLISNTGADTVSKARPLKILNYLQGEAVRMARQLTKDQSKEEILMLLESIRDTLPENCDSCFHGKYFFYDLYNLNDIPLTQTQTIS
ncbi:hypothetical protein FSP39_012027 [Pinctada imbricata]|uniref:HMG box domain-containing protein n=1 Tax=Pinctada imbricata TaxID=66713 RepID=A0AA89C0L2_PINIB|nr:hypothetical protein FSP39_012027 [Pinctada imbricata]